MSRRSFFSKFAALAAGLFAAPKVLAETQPWQAIKYAGVNEAASGADKMVISMLKFDEDEWHIIEYNADKIWQAANKTKPKF